MCLCVGSKSSGLEKSIGSFHIEVKYSSEAGTVERFGVTAGVAASATPIKPPPVSSEAMSETGAAATARTMLKIARNLAFFDNARLV